MRAVQDHWEHFEHGADVGVCGISSTKAGAFGRAVLALTAVETDPAQVQPCRVIELDCQAADDELLLTRKEARLAPLVCIKG